MEIWLELCFDGEAVDNIVCSSEEEVQDILQNHSKNFHEQNNEIVQWWLEEGFRDNPVVTIERRCNMMNDWEKAFKEAIEEASHWVNANKELEVIHWDGNEECVAGWYAYEYDGDQSVPIYANDYDRTPLIDDNTAEEHDVNVVKVLNMCKVSWCG